MNQKISVTKRKIRKIRAVLLEDFQMQGIDDHTPTGLLSDVLKRVAGVPLYAYEMQKIAQEQLAEARAVAQEFANVNHVRSYLYKNKETGYIVRDENEQRAVYDEFLDQFSPPFVPSVEVVQMALAEV